MAEVTSTAALTDKLNKLNAIYESISKFKSYTIMGKTYTQHDLSMVAAEIAMIEGRLSRRLHGSMLAPVIVR